MSITVRAYQYPRGNGLNVPISPSQENALVLMAHLSVIVHNFDGTDSAICTSNTVSHEHQYLSVDPSNTTVTSDINGF